MQVVTIVGARPQFVKAAVISREIQQREGVKEILVHTGQHYDQNMSDVFFDELKIPKPDYNLNINEKTHGAQTGKMLEAIEHVLLKHSPDWVLVYGDTNSTLAGALAASKLHLPIAHVEAGLRSFNKKMPEEVNRVVTDHVSDALFTPSADADKNLVNEGVAPEKIFRFGDVMRDAHKFYSNMLNDADGLLESIGVQSGEYILSTIHRAENTDNPACLKAIFSALIE
ncbi:UDP-N-acetylglucosamine 2-epimerase (non-hydrolyzing), partial [bacterium]|nr:UDP-N-acetylglucosamine 2-epimerase (non-hydrolyzing) [bacterium]